MGTNSRLCRLVRPLVLALVVVTAGLGAVGCSTDTTCVEGRSVSCTCANGKAGTQVCQSDGTWGACRCRGGDVAVDSDSASADAFGDVDASPGDSDAGISDTVDGDTSDGGRPTRGLIEHVDFDERSMEIYTHEGQTGVPENDEALEFVQTPSREGSHAVRVHMESTWSFDGVNSARVNPVIFDDDRARLHSAGYSTYDQPFWTGLSLYVPENWKPDDYTEQILEFHRNIFENPGSTKEEKLEYADAEGGGGKPLTLRVDGSDLQAVNDKLPKGDDQWGFDDRERKKLTPLQPGNWYDIVMRIKWSNKSTSEEGFIKIWVDGSLEYEDRGENCVPDVAPPRPMKFGIYKWVWDDGKVDNQSRTYVFDEIRFGSSQAVYETVAPGDAR